MTAWLYYSNFADMLHCLYLIIINICKNRLLFQLFVISIRINYLSLGIVLFIFLCSEETDLQFVILYTFSLHLVLFKKFLEISSLA